MFQSFDVKGGPEHGRRNLPKLRKAMAAQALDAFIVPHEDEYQNEYLPEANERLAWATGFTGSAGAAIVTGDQAVLFADGRYTIQARAQTDPKLFDTADLVAAGPAKWLAANAKPGQRIGYDPRLHSPDAVKPLAEAAAKAGARLVAVDANPIDEAWSDRPAAPSAPLAAHPLEHAGETHADKRARVAESLREARVDLAVLTAPASIAWLLNVRGGDVAHTPLPLCAAAIANDGAVELFVAPEKITDAVRAHLGNEVAIRDETELEGRLTTLQGMRVRLDPASASAWFFSKLETTGAIVARGPDPCALPRACKNAVEIAGARAAHARDGVALARFLHWAGTQAQDGKTDEITGAVKLEELRREAPELKDLSFESISGAGANGAIVHYRVNVKTNRKLKRGSLYLIDSGAQYPDGTTDVTRTVAIGRPSKEMRQRYTLVLKGHIALATVRFPEGTTGAHLDALARRDLWAAGLDYDHGTGHGVGSYLGVHEGPQRIARALNGAALKAGMIVSNEPGYYKEGAYGIRIENLQVVTEPVEIEGGDRKMLGFETLTVAPFDRVLIVKAMLSKDERTWVDAYHAKVLETVGPKLDAETRGWLEGQCAPL